MWMKRQTGPARTTSIRASRAALAAIPRDEALLMLDRLLQEQGQ